MNGNSTSPLPLQVVAALIVRPGEILICQRKEHQAFPLQWEFPGGKVESGEDYREALVRELDEELGIRAKVGRRAAIIRHDYKTSRTVELHFFVVERFDGEIDNRIFHDVRWESLANLPEYKFLEADRALIRDLAAGNLL